MEIILYSTGCPRCLALREMLDVAGITYTYFFDTDKMIEMGLTTVPVLEVNGRKMGYKEAIEWIKKGGERS